MTDNLFVTFRSAHSPGPPPHAGDASLVRVSEDKSMQDWLQVSRLGRPESDRLLKHWSSNKETSAGRSARHTLLMQRPDIDTSSSQDVIMRFHKRRPPWLWMRMGFWIPASDWRGFKSREMIKLSERTRVSCYICCKETAADGNCLEKSQESYCVLGGCRTIALLVMLCLWLIQWGGVSS